MKLQKSNLGNICLMIAGTLVGLISFAHVLIIIGGASWYRAFGAGEQMAALAEHGSWKPAAATTVIVVILALWSLYAFSGAQKIRRLPFMKTSLSLIASIFLIRGIWGCVYWSFIFAGDHPVPNSHTLFILLTSFGSSFLGACYLIGLIKNWELLKN